MSYKEMARRLDELERGTPDGNVEYVIDVGLGFVDWQGERISLDEWNRRYPDAVWLDIGGTLNDENKT